jgi:hypothetical protein
LFSKIQKAIGTEKAFFSWPRSSDPGPLRPVAHKDDQIEKLNENGESWIKPAL